MRKEIYRMTRDEAVALFARATVVHLATTGHDGSPILRTVHGVVRDGALFFHGAPAGEKQRALGRPAVVSCEETIAEIPSTFLDPERACPATTYYLSAQAHGVLVEIEDPREKARALQALMEKLQPEGGYVPIHEEHPLYRGAVDGVLVVRVALDRIDGKAKLGQNRRPEDVARVVSALWQRGRPGDARAVECVLRANPAVPVPPFLVGPQGTRLACHLEPSRVADAVALLCGTYWNEGVPAGKIAAAILGSSVWVGAVDAAGDLVATARGLSDGATNAWIYDVVVRPDRRGAGIGTALIRMLLQHPGIRHARKVRLGTRDAQPLYARFGFVDARLVSTVPGATEMVLLRPAGP